jgi:hypothetical protein
MSELEYMQLMVRWEDAPVDEARRIREAYCGGVRVQSLCEAPESALMQYLCDMHAQGWTMVSTIAPSPRFNLYVFERRTDPERDSSAWKPSFFRRDERDSPTW